MTTEFKADDIILVDGAAARIISIKGRWVKLDDGSNISRAEAAEGREEYLEMIENEEETEEELDDEAEETEVTMSKILLKYRATYVKAVSNSGNASLNNGDEVAALLQALSPDETCAVADHLFGEFPGTHFAKYQGLNNGSRRMNAGNRIRALIKRGTKTIADLEAAIRGDDLVDDEAAV